ncbi:hypothetical protein [Clostridium thermarum]|uniref:hypothetical protein n=1 Tax=Clostridium thermarum TaxID=1716543 RepID=UPI00111D0A1C|nr:hypothetical protein [Clostridium thermarum]
MNITKILILAMISEAVWETFKMTWQNGKLSADRIGAMVIGILIAISTGIDIMELVEIPIFIPYLGTILTGLLISRGANFIHDLLSSAGNMSKNTKFIKNNTTTDESDKN